jgi:hypothetical protein
LTTEEQKDIFDEVAAFKKSSQKINEISKKQEEKFMEKTKEPKVKVPRVKRTDKYEKIIQNHISAIKDMTDNASDRRFIAGQVLKTLYFEKKKSLAK